ncbi:MAG: hypothetical protein N2257_08500 [Thermodesulfovibrionales bacterium]|nr:hypothetical protein [Thermodesulfovibrionales bacterium]
MELFKRIVKQSILLTLIAIVLSAILAGNLKFSLGVFVGSLAGILNLRAIVKNVSSITGGQRITGRYIIFSTFRLIGLFALLFILIWKRIADVFGILLGFTIIFFMIIKEGLKEARQMR